MSQKLPDELLITGEALPVMEEFYSIQGEGYNTGQAAYFIRVGGCDVGCKWCDVKESWVASKFPPVLTDEVVQRIAREPAKSVVVTGGEPLLYNMGYLCEKLHAQHIRIFLETSGSQSISGSWDWICVSPKRDVPPLPEMLKLADELKVIICDPGDFQWAEENSAEVSENCLLYLQPEWSRHKIMMPEIVDYVKRHPNWRICLQSHKYMRIP